LPNSSEETFLLPDGFLTALDPQVRLLTLPNFGVNTKTEYMMCDFSMTGHEDGVVSLDGQVVAKKETFRYLGSVLQKDGDIDEDVRHRI
jgi:hypothetical protein